VSLTDDVYVAAAAESTDDTDDVWSTEMQSPVTENVDKTATVGDVKRSSQEFHEDLLHIKPYVYCIGQHSAFVASFSAGLLFGRLSKRTFSVGPTNHKFMCMSDD